LRIERAGHTATRLPSGKILVVGGENANGPVRDSEIFDPAARTFTPATGLLTARADHTATRLPDGRLFVIGGRASGQSLNSSEIYDPETGVFSSGPGLNRARAGHTATLLPDGRVVVVGGDADGSIEVFDPQAGTFSLLEARLAVPRRSHAAALLQNGEILIAGGNASNGAVLDSAELLDPTLAFTSITPSMKVARSRPAMRVLPDGKVQVIGGDPEATMELFNPDGGYFTSLAHPAANPALLSAALRTQTRAVVIGHPLPMKLKGTDDVTAVPAEAIDRTGYSLTEIPELNQALATGGTGTSGKFRTTSALFATSAAAVTTDKTDYVPGQTVIITGTGWQPGETVNLNIHRDTNTPPDTVLTAAADALGNIQNSDYVVQDYDLGVTFLLTATGQTSGFTAQTTFTDNRAITAATVDGSSTTTVTPGATITASVTVNTTTSGGGGENWFSTSWIYATSSPAINFNTPCADTPDHTIAGTFTESFSTTAPLTPGTYNAYFLAWRTASCGNNQSNLFVLPNAVIVNAPPTVAFTTAPATANEGETKHYVYTVTDPGDTFTVVAGFPTCGAGNTLSNATTTTGGGSFDCAFTDGPQSPNVQIQVKDSANNLSNTATQAVTVSNVAPTASFTGPASVNEGPPATYGFSAQSDPSSTDTATGFHYAYDCNGGSLAGATYASSGTSASTSCTFPDGNASKTVRARILDKDDGFTEYTVAVTVNNVAPVLTGPANQTADEGTAKSFSLGSFTDPGADSPWSVVVTWGDSTPNTTFNATSTGTLASQSHTYADNGTYTVTVKVTDKDGADSNVASFQVTVSNVAPTASLANNGPINEGGSATVSFSGQSDPSSADTTAGFRYAYSCANGDLSGATYAGSGTSA